MTRWRWWTIERLAWFLDAKEREVVLGDFAECGTPAPRALLELLGLVARRQAVLWSNWLLHSALGIAVGSVLCYFLMSHVYGYLLRLLAGAMNAVLGSPHHVVYLSPWEPFTIYAKLSVLCGFFLASPYILWRLWLTASPVFLRRKKRYAWSFVAVMTALLFAGATLAFQAVLPQVLRFLISSSSGSPLITMNESWNLAITTVVGVALLFEIPGLCWLLYLRTKEGEPAGWHAS